MRGEPQLGHTREVHGLPAVWLTFLPHFGQTQFPAGPAPDPPRFPLRPLFPAAGPVPSFPGM